MNVHELTTPHPESSAYAHGELQRPLLEAINTAELRESIAASQDPNTARLAAAALIQNETHNALRFKVGQSPMFRETPNGNIEGIIPPDQKTTCIGYALVMDKVLDMAGVDSHFIYFKGHFMNGIVTHDDEKPQLNMFDVHNNELSQNMTNTMAPGSVQDMLDAEVTYSRGVARINTAQLLKNAGLDPDEFTYDPKTADLTWLYYQKGKSFHYGQGQITKFGGDERRAWENRYTAFMSLYSREIGRRILPAYATFTQAVGSENTPQALRSLKTMRDTKYKVGLFPEIDGRLEHDKIEKLVKTLVKQGRVIDALEATAFYCTSFACSQDCRLKGIEAGLYYDIAVTTDDPIVAALGEHAYSQALGEILRPGQRRPEPSDTFEGKREILRKIIRRHDLTKAA